MLKAIEEAKKQGIEVSRPTLTKWIVRHNIGFQLGEKGGKWYVFPEKFLRYINGGKIQRTEAEANNTTNICSATGQADAESSGETTKEITTNI
jgi:hypothetical protein